MFLSRCCAVRHPAHEQGVAMLDVLIAILVVALGLLALAGVQGRMTVAVMEAYQRAQALSLLQEMVNRINANRKNSMSYHGVAVGEGYLGGAEQDCSGMTGANLDVCEWHNALLGNTEKASGKSTGAMIAARGCVTNSVPAMPREFLVSVAWQGLAPTAAPTTTSCGQDQYGDEAMRRAVVARVRIGCLQNDPVTGFCVTP